MALRVLLRVGVKLVKERPLTLVTVQESHGPMIFPTAGYLSSNAARFATTTRYWPAFKMIFVGKVKAMPPEIVQPERFTFVPVGLCSSTYSSRGFSEAG